MARPLFYKTSVELDQMVDRYRFELQLGWCAEVCIGRHDEIASADRYAMTGIIEDPCFGAFQAV